MVAVVKCRVSINGEVREGEGGREERRTGAGQCRRTMAFRWWGAGGQRVGT